MHLPYNQPGDQWKCWKMLVHGWAKNDMMIHIFILIICQYNWSYLSWWLANIIMNIFRAARTKFLYDSNTLTKIWPGTTLPVNVYFLLSSTKGRTIFCQNFVSYNMTLISKALWIFFFYVCHVFCINMDN